MSLVLPFPPPPSSPHYPLSSRSTTPRPTTPLSAPPTPVNPTHLLPAAMERARSSEGIVPTLSTNSDPGQRRESRSRDVKETMLKAEWEHVEQPPSPLHSQIPVDEEEKMDVDEVGGVPDEDREMLVEDATSQVAGGGQLKEVGGEESVPLGEPISQADQQVKVHLPTAPEEGRPFVWGMPKWGREPERKEVRKGVRLVGMEELPGLVERHSMIDTPSSVLFPWLHGISDDGQKGRDMAAFFGYGPPFEPPPYRGLTLMFCPPHPLDETHRPQPLRTDSDRTTQQPVYPMHQPRERSETMSTSSDSYHSTGTTEATSPSLGELSPPPFGAKLGSDSEEAVEEEADVAMHPCDSKRVSLAAVSKGLDEEHHPLPCGKLDAAAEETSSGSESDADDLDSEDQRPNCIMFNALHVHDVFDLPKHRNDKRQPRFRPARLPNQINLRNLNIQQIKYATVSDIVLYSKHGAGNGVLELAEHVAMAQQELWESRMEEFYKHVGGSRNAGEGSSEPVRYGVWVVLEPFWKLERYCPHLVNIDSKGTGSLRSMHTDLFEREARESRAMTKGSEVVEGFWVGNDCDVPGGADDGVGASASECAEMPTSESLASAYRKLHDLDRRRQGTEERTSSWIASPATIALRNLLSPSSPSSANAFASDVPAKRTASPSPDQRNLRPRSNLVNGPLAEPEYVALECAGSCRTITGQTRNLSHMTDKVIELVYFLRKIVEGRDTSGKKRRVLVHCQDGYTESSIIVLAYIMSSLSISLPEAFLHLQLVAKRSFFLYPSDKPLLRKIDSRLAADRRSRAMKLVSATNASPPSTLSSTTPSRSGSGEEGRSSLSWRSWGIGFGAGKASAKEKEEATLSAASPNAKGKKEKVPSTVEVAKDMLSEQENGGSEAQTQAKVWFEDRRFDGFPSRILPFLYLGNLEHAGNAAMLHALRITHVVSVGESLINVPPDMDPTYGPVGGNTLAAEAKAGKISVLDLTDVRDDGNDPLRPVIARACAWIEAARREGGIVLVHCRVGVSRSASIVIAYMMQFEKMGLMDAYMICRARRLNVLIQPNLRFFHELFGWEVELARQEEELGRKRREEAERSGVRDPEALRLAMEGEKRRIMYSWPSFCRDLHCLNRRFLCN
ncbi:hypothetical protein CI109_101171 [Kwoniella shandongensis]|uniref:Protein-tyrosine-phosphatase n=1 Tax=Kwoniella shandongensis TaxID=1734106 RepID=A0AAJ8LG48_9TREE